MITRLFKRNVNLLIHNKNPMPLEHVNIHHRDLRIQKSGHAYVILNEHGQIYPWQPIRVTQLISSIKQDSDKFDSGQACLGTYRKIMRLFAEWITIIQEQGLNNPELLPLHVRRANHFEPKHLVMFDMPVLERFEQYVAAGMYLNPQITHEQKVEFFGELLYKVKLLPIPKGTAFTKQHVIEGWNKQAVLGSALHAYAEDYLNNKPTTLDDKPLEYQLMAKFLNDYKHLNWYRTEYMIFDEDYKTAGCIDAMTVRDGNIAHLFDFKRSYALKEDPSLDEDLKRSKKLKPPFDYLRSTKRTMFAIQLSVYAFILEHKYGFIVERLSLVVVYPYNENYFLIDVPYYKDIAKYLLENPPSSQPKIEEETF
jgi:hypothetical protein